MRLEELKSLLSCEMLGRMWGHQFLNTSELILEKNNNHHTIVGIHWPLAWQSHVLQPSPYTAALDFGHLGTLFQTHSYVEKSQNTVFPRYPTSNMHDAHRKFRKKNSKANDPIPTTAARWAGNTENRNGALMITSKVEHFTITSTWTTDHALPVLSVPQEVGKSQQSPWPLSSPSNNWLHL